MLAVYHQMEKHFSFLMRGTQVGDFYTNFIVTGLKEDINTKLKIAHSPKLDKSAFFEMEMRSKPRGMFFRHIYPLVMSLAGCLSQLYIGCKRIKLNYMVIL